MEKFLKASGSSDKRKRDKEERKTKKKAEYPERTN